MMKNFYDHYPEVLGFDTETTGVDTQTCRIVTVSLVKRFVAHGEIRENTAQWLLNADVEIPQNASDVHGITTEKMRDEGLEPRGVLDYVAETIVETLKNDIPLVAFNAGFDTRILETELERHGLATVTQRLGETRARAIIDPLVLDRGLDKWRKGGRKLIDACGVYGVAVPDNLHDALVDVQTTLDVAAAMAVKYPDVGWGNSGALFERQRLMHKAWAENFSSYLMKKGEDASGVSMEWLPFA